VWCFSKDACSISVKNKEKNFSEVLIPQNYYKEKGGREKPEIPEEG
jgi:hypothetical protein